MKQLKNFRAGDLFGAFLLLLALAGLLFAAALRLVAQAPPVNAPPIVNCGAATVGVGRLRRALACPFSSAVELAHLRIAFYLYAEKVR